MKKDKQYYLDLPYEITFKRLSDNEGGGYFAHYNDKGLNMIMGDGATVGEALKDVKSAFDCYLDKALRDGCFIPEPKLNSENEEKIKRIDTISPVRCIKKNR